MKNLIGMTEEEAKAELILNDKVFRVVYRDGKSFTVTADYRQDRYNLAIKDGVVTGYSNG